MCSIGVSAANGSAINIMRQPRFISKSAGVVGGGARGCHVNLRWGVVTVTSYQEPARVGRIIFVC